MEILPFLITKAKSSSAWLYVLNFLLAHRIPFNGPHGFRLMEISKNTVKTLGPYKRKNFNHIRGIHACGIATVAEFSSGFLLLSRLDPTIYRLIMAKLTAEYYYQAKEDIIGATEFAEKRLQQEIIMPLQQSESTSVIMQTEVSDLSGNQVAAVETTWQVKRWDAVQTKV